MATVKQVLAQKRPEVLTVGAEVTVLDAALRMNEHRIGSLVVVDEAGQVAGIVTERDVLRRVVARRRDPGEALVGEVMTQEVVCCRPEATVDEARAVFKHRRIRHLPVVGEDGRLEGMISIGDLNAWQLDGAELELNYLHDYLAGRM